MVRVMASLTIGGRVPEVEVKAQSLNQMIVYEYQHQYHKCITRFLPSFNFCGNREV